MQSLNKDLIKNSLSVDNVKDILMDLGAPEPRYNKNDNSLICKTICHGGSKNKLYYYIDSRLFVCYSGCSDSFDIYELVLRVKRVNGVKLTFPQVVRYIAKMSGLFLYNNSDFQDEEESLIDDWSWLNKFNQEEENEDKKNKIYNENILEMFCYKPHISWIKDGISSQAMRKFEIGFWDKVNKITIPHRDICGNLIGIRGRALNKEEIEAGMKYMPLIVEGNILNHALGNNLYGIHQNKDTIVKTGKLFLVESEKSVLQIETMYPDFNYSLAVCGSNVSDTQVEIIKELGVTKCYIAFDKEYDDFNSRIGELYCLKLLKFAQKLNPYMTVYLILDRQNLLNKKDSPSDRGKEVFEKLLDDKIEVTDELIEKGDFYKKGINGII